MRFKRGSRPPQARGSSPTDVRAWFGPAGPLDLPDSAGPGSAGLPASPPRSGLGAAALPWVGKAGLTRSECRDRGAGSWRGDCGQGLAPLGQGWGGGEGCGVARRRACVTPACEGGSRSRLWPREPAQAGGPRAGKGRPGLGTLGRRSAALGGPS